MKHTPQSTVNAIFGHLRDILIVVVIGNIISFAFGQDLTNFWEQVKFNSLYSALIGGALWKGNQYIGHFVGKKIDVTSNPHKALRWNLSVMFIYTVLAIIVVNYIWVVVIFDRPFRWLYTSMLLTMLIELFVTVAITSIFFSIGFFKAWRESAVNEERLQKESIKLQYQALKNQVNPHFLFNSLNSLTSLVNQDQKQATKFIKELSEVYRYILSHKDNELVRLVEEIDFAKKYVYLQKIRLDSGLQVDFSIRDKKDLFVVPVSVQILIENAIKHNEASEDNPLKIEIKNTSEHLLVSNNLQPKTTTLDSGGIGLNTIRGRYGFLTGKNVITREQNGFFIVELPIINKIQR
jgi:sensor histidine kinase YesM